MIAKANENLLIHATTVIGFLRMIATAYSHKSIIMCMPAKDTHCNDKYATA
jgi:hypothetical protein